MLILICEEKTSFDISVHSKEMPVQNFVNGRLNTYLGEIETPCIPKLLRAIVVCILNQS